MVGPTTVEEIVPLVEALSAAERARLLRLIVRTGDGDSSAYAANPPGSEEFAADGDPLAWESDGWESVA